MPSTDFLLAGRGFAPSRGTARQSSAATGSPTGDTSNRWSPNLGKPLWYTCNAESGSLPGGFRGEGCAGLGDGIGIVRVPRVTRGTPLGMLGKVQDPLADDRSTGRRGHRTCRLWGVRRRASAASPLGVRPRRRLDLAGMRPETRSLPRDDPGLLTVLLTGHLGTVRHVRRVAVARGSEAAGGVGEDDARFCRMSVYVPLWFVPVGGAFVWDGSCLACWGLVLCVLFRFGVGGCCQRCWLPLWR